MVSLPRRNSVPLILGRNSDTQANIGLEVKVPAWASDPVPAHFTFQNVCEWVRPCWHSAELCIMFWNCVCLYLSHQPQEAISRQESKCYSQPFIMTLTGMWPRVKQESLMLKKLRAQKRFFTSKWKEGDYINIKLWVENHGQAAFLTLGAHMIAAPWITRETTLDLSPDIFFLKSPLF